VDQAAIDARRQELSREYPEDFEDPLEYYDEDHDLDDVDEATLFALLAMQAKADPSFKYEDHVGPPRLVTAGDRVFEQTGEEDGVAVFGHWSTAGDFLADVRMSDRFHEFYGDSEGRFNEEFWEYPVPLYHGTDDLEGVLAEGINPMSETRGISNRSVGAAVFTSLNDGVADQYGSGTDGGVVMIDTEAMKRDGYTPFVSQEPEVLEEELSAALMHRLGQQYDIEYSDSGMDPDTVVIDGRVPKQYLTDTSSAV
jgi:hypothetical protein